MKINIKRWRQEWSCLENNPKEKWTYHKNECCLQLQTNKMTRWREKIVKNWKCIWNNSQEVKTVRDRGQKWYIICDWRKKKDYVELNIQCRTLFNSRFYRLKRQSISGRYQHHESSESFLKRVHGTGLLMSKRNSKATMSLRSSNVNVVTYEC